MIKCTEEIIEIICRAYTIIGDHGETALHLFISSPTSLTSELSAPLCPCVSAR